MKPLRILIADDHEMVRRGLRAVLGAHPGWEICEEADNGRSAVEKAKRLRPDMIVMDITMPDLNGLEATRQIVQALPRAQVVILTMHETNALMQSVLEAGARGYVLKSDAGTELVAAVEAVSLGKPFFTTAVSEMMLENLKRLCGAAKRKLPYLALSPRQMEILQLVAAGKSNKEIAGVLRVSVRTVESHRTNIMKTLRLQSLSDLVRYAIRNKIIEA